MLADALGGEDGLELRDLVDGVDVVEALDAVAIALVDGVDAQETGLRIRAGFTALADGDGFPGRGDAAVSTG